MKNKIYYVLFFILLGSKLSSQVGIGTPNPRGALDINEQTTNNKGLVLPTNASTNNMVNPMGGAIAIGTIMYDSTLSCVRVYKSTGWSNCLCDQCEGMSGFTLDCSSGTLTGTFKAGEAINNASKVINYTNATGQAYNAVSVSSTGVTGLTAKTSAGTLANGNGNITLNISGTPSTAGMASFTVNIDGKSCTFTVNVDSNSPVVSALNCDGALTGNYTQGVASNGTKIISYTGGNGNAYGAISISSTGVTGLTAKASAGTLANGNGNITLNISGTPSATGLANFAVNLGSQTCTFSVNMTASSRVVNILNIYHGNEVISAAKMKNKLTNTINFGAYGIYKGGGKFGKLNVQSLDAANFNETTFKAAMDAADIITIEIDKAFNNNNIGQIDFYYNYVTNTIAGNSKKACIITSRISSNNDNSGQLMYKFYSKTTFIDSFNKVIFGNVEGSATSVGLGVNSNIELLSNVFGNITNKAYNNGDGQSVSRGAVNALWSASVVPPGETTSGNLTDFVDSRWQNVLFRTYKNGYRNITNDDKCAADLSSSNNNNIGTVSACNSFAWALDQILQ